MPVYVRGKQVEARYNISRTTRWRWIKSGRLPKPEQIGPGIAATREDLLDEADEKWAARVAKGKAEGAGHD
ncbi:hypothetical protein A3731_07275 [Roseovarius sp. HI0049]|nr:hypothetical protein A3731_07275 [Roseovarius sp. HI0049]